MSETEMTSSITDILQHDSENDDEYEPSDSSVSIMYLFYCLFYCIIWILDR